MTQPRKGVVNFLQEFSIPLIAGVFVALFHANLGWEGYQSILEWHPFGTETTLFGHHVTFKFLIDDVFMVFFFGIAAKEITEACLPGGSLNPMGKAMNPLFATLGGVVGPVGVFFAALWVFHSGGAFPEGSDWGTLQKGWGVPTATDIALAWLVARTVFGAGHPAVNFLLLLAVADDAIGLGIIAVFYGDPAHPAQPLYLLLVLGGMVAALGMRLARVKYWGPYVFLAGPLAWSGLMMAHLHPALALVFIVPFLPGPERDTGLFAERDEADEAEAAHLPNPVEHSALHLFEHNMKLPVDIGLFFFAYANAGVQLAGIGPMTWIILLALVVGKTVGITFFGLLATKVGFPLPDRMGLKELAMAGFVAALGLTVALFVATAAFDPGTPEGLALQGQAKMGALFSGFVGIAAIVIGKALGFGGGAGTAEASASASTGDARGAEDRTFVEARDDSVAGALPADAPGRPASHT